MNIDILAKAREEKGISYARLSELTGISAGALHKILTGETKNPRKDNLDLLEEILIKNTPDSACKDKGGNWLCTLEDYYREAEVRRVELIHGSLCDMPQTDQLHQLLLIPIIYAFGKYIETYKGPCVVMTSSIDVQLNEDENTLVHPDMVVICDETKVHRNCIFGAPDFVLEIMTPESRTKDMFLKSYMYAEAGVREYWLLDPEKQMLISFYFESGNLFPKESPLEGKCGVNIYNGRLQINLDELRDIINRYGKV